MMLGYRTLDRAYWLCSRGTAFGWDAKQILNLPSKVCVREIQDGMYYDNNPDELYNDGSAFKLTFRDSSEWL